MGINHLSSEQKKQWDKIPLELRCILCLSLAGISPREMIEGVPKNKKLREWIVNLHFKTFLKEE